MMLEEWDGSLGSCVWEEGGTKADMGEREMMIGGAI